MFAARFRLEISDGLYAQKLPGNTLPQAVAEVSDKKLSASQRRCLSIAVVVCCFENDCVGRCGLILTFGWAQARGSPK